MRSKSNLITIKKDLKHFHLEEEKGKGKQSGAKITLRKKKDYLRVWTLSQVGFLSFSLFSQLYSQFTWSNYSPVLSFSPVKACTSPFWSDILSPNFFHVSPHPINFIINRFFAMSTLSPSETSKVFPTQETIDTPHISLKPQATLTHFKKKGNPIIIITIRSRDIKKKKKKVKS